MKKDYYEILGIARGASFVEIQKAYRQKARRYHPDIVGTGGVSIFLKIQRAYEVLSDPLKKQEYDDAQSVKFVADSMDYARKLWAKRI